MHNHPFSRGLLLVAAIIVIAPPLRALDLKQLMQANSPAVVTIIVLDSAGHEHGQGTGFYIDSTTIVTCRHVVEAGASLRIKNAFVDAVIAGVVADDIGGDLALLSGLSAPKGVTPLRIAAKRGEVGDHVVLIGSPRGLDNTVSEGIVSSIRSRSGIVRVLQFTAPMSDGSSGSPLFNGDGDVVGVATAVYLEGQNINFATGAERIRGMARHKPTPVAEWNNVAIRNLFLRQNPGEAMDDKIFSQDTSTLTFVCDYAEGRGEDYYSQSNWKASLDMFLTALNNQQMRPHSWLRAGECELRLEHGSEARSYLENAVRLLPRSAEAWNELGKARYGTDDRAGALAAWRKSTELDPRNGDAWVALGTCLCQLGRAAEAVVPLQNAVRCAPKNVDAHYSLAKAMQFTGKRDEAIREYRAALRIDSTAFDVNAALGELYLRLDSLPQAAEATERALRKNNRDPHVWEMRASILMAQNRPAGAASSLRSALAITPKDPALMCELGDVLIEQHAIDSAMTLYQSAIQIDPKFPPAHFCLGKALFVFGHDRAGALEEYSVLQTLDADLAKQLFDVIYAKQKRKKK